MVKRHLIISLGIGLILVLGQGAEAKAQKKSQVEVKAQKKTLVGTWAIKTKPPYNIGDVIGYSQPGLPERYIGKVVVKGEWCRNTAEGEYDGKRIGEVSIAIDIQGNIYIVNQITNYIDPKAGTWELYHWINKYDEKGNILFSKRVEHPYGLCIDEEGNIYGDYYNDKNNLIIRKHDSQLNMIAEWRVPWKKMEKGGERLICKKGELFYKTPNKLYKLNTKSTKGTLSVIEDLEIEDVTPYKEMTDLEEGNLYELYLEAQEQTKTKGKKILKLNIPEYTEDTKWFPALTKNVIEVNEKGDIYVFTHITPHKMTYQVVPETWRLWKYDKESKLLAAIDLSRGPGEVSADPMLHRGELIVDTFGNVYQLREDEKDGIYIIKWERIK